MAINAEKLAERKDKLHRAVLIKWADHASIGSGEWLRGGLTEAIEKAESIADTVSIGWLVHETDDYYLLVQSIGEDGIMDAGLKILKSTVTEKRNIKDPYARILHQFIG